MPLRKSAADQGAGLPPLDQTRDHDPNRGQNPEGSDRDGDLSLFTVYWENESVRVRCVYQRDFHRVPNKNQNTDSDSLNEQRNLTWISNPTSAVR